MSPTKTPEETFETYDMSVHFFGDAIAILYSSGSAVHVEGGWRKHKVNLTLTDTWLKRNGIWQVPAAQDMPSEAK